jgi:hypothetical protein
MNGAQPAERIQVVVPRVHRDPVDQPAIASFEVSPWPLMWRHAHGILVAVMMCVALLMTVELAIFRSGFFVSHVSVSNPDTPSTKLALASHVNDVRVLYVGDSTVMTGIAPAVVSAACECGDGFNAGFKTASPWLTAALTRQLVAEKHPELVVIGVAPWTVDTSARFEDGEYAREVLSPAEFAALGAPLDAVGMIDHEIRSSWSLYGDRLLLWAWLGSLLPGQRYDESLRGFYVPAGSGTSATQLAATAGQLLGEPREASSSAAGANVFGTLIDELRSRGTAVALFVPPLHPAARELAGPYLDRADVAIREFAQRYDVPLIDCRSTVSAADFRDLDHPIETGAVKQSQCVGANIRTILQSGRAVQ